MKLRLLHFVVIPFLSLVALAQSTAPIATYTLHAHKEPQKGFSLAPTVALPSTLLSMTAENALLVLIPQEDGEWVLKRLAGWDTKAPQEQSLKIVGEHTPEDNVWVVADLTLNPNGSYLIVRINYRHGAIERQQRNREAVVTVVDLHTFRIVSRRVTTDPLLADSEWRFDEQGKLITTGLASRLSVSSPSLHTVTDTYDASALSLPDLMPTASCQYSTVIELRNGSSGWTKPISNDTSDGCTALLETANVLSVLELPGRARNIDDIGKLAGADCQITDFSRVRNLALVECRTGHSYMDGEINTTSSRAMKVYALPDGKAVLSIPLPHNWHSIPGLLATISGQDYLILVREGINVEVYRLR